MAHTKTEDLPYPLKRDALASTRLNFNHFWMKGLAGYLLHPKIPTDEKTLRIVDLGAGTGIWASEVSATLPTATFDVVDISAEQFPPEPIRPPNVRFWTHDCFLPFPDDYLGQFDIVNARFWKCIVNDDVADKILDNFLTLLRPGGYIQWFEPLPDTTRVVARNDGAPHPACDKLVEMWKKPTPQSSYKYTLSFSMSWMHTLAASFEKRGLEVVAEDKHHNPDRYLPIAAQSVLLGLSEWLYRDPAIEVYQEQLASEHREGVYVDITWTCVVARKPV